MEEQKKIKPRISSSSVKTVKKITPKIHKPKPSVECRGCGAMMVQGNRYEGDDWDWCDDCFCSEEKLKEVREQMPIWQDILHPKKIKPRLAAGQKKKQQTPCTSEADGAASHAPQ